MGVLVWKRGVFRSIVGALLFEATENDFAIDQLKPGLKVNGAVYLSNFIFFIYFLFI